MAEEMELDEETTQLCRDLVGEPELDGWVHVATMGGGAIYCRERKDSMILEFKCMLVLDFITPKCFFEMLRDMEYIKQKFDRQIREVQMYEDETEDCVYQEIRYPFPMANRELLYAVREWVTVLEEQTLILMKQDIKEFSTPLTRAWTVRNIAYKQYWVVMSDGEDGMRGMMYYYEDPGGTSPKCIINSLLRGTVPNWVCGLRGCCQDYPVYRAKKQLKSPKKKPHAEEG